jgi:hypothetical protein
VLRNFRRALERAVPDARSALLAKIPTLARAVDGWLMNPDTMGVYGNYYLKRALVALVGLSANLPEDTVYPINLGDVDGKPLHSSNKYVLHFAKDEIRLSTPSNRSRCTTRTGSPRPMP